MSPLKENPRAPAPGTKQSESEYERKVMEAILSGGIQQEEALGIIKDVFATMLEVQTRPADAQWQPRSDEYTAAIYFAGAWKGAMMLEASFEQAEFFTRRLMAAIPEPNEDDIFDAMGELANMVGGNFKSLLPPGSSLSMPSVVRGSDYSLRLCGNHANHRMTVECYSGDMPLGIISVTLIEMIEK
jgi:chemotaxis protein CheX